MSKSHIFASSRKLAVFGTVLVVLSLVLAACQSSPIPATGSTPGVESTLGTELTPAVVATQPSTGETMTSPTQEATSMATQPSGMGTSTAPSVGATLDATKIAGEEAEVEVEDDSTLGQILVGRDGMTLYAFTDDTENTVNCTGACLMTWIPLATQGTPDLGDGVDESLVGTATLPDGGQVVTYNGHPLYYYVGDFAKGDVNGQGLNSKWYVVSPAGELVGQ